MEKKFFSAETMTNTGFSIKFLNLNLNLNLSLHEHRTLNPSARLTATGRPGMMKAEMKFEVKKIDHKFKSVAAATLRSAHIAES